MNECPICNGQVRKVETEFSLFEGKIKKNPVVGHECMECGEIFIDEDESRRIDKWLDEPTTRKIVETLRKHEFRLRRKIGYSGRTLVVRIPKDIERIVPFSEGEEVEIYPEGKNRIIIEKL